MTSLRSVLSRADTAVLQGLLGQSTVRLLSALGGGAVTPGKLTEILLALRSPAELILDAGARATITELLRPEEAEQLVRVAGLAVGGDAFDTLGAVRLTRRSSTLPLWFQYFGVESLPDEARSRSAPTLEIPPQAGLFPHQRNAIRRIDTALRQRRRRVVLHMPTGSGKTRVAMNVVASHLRVVEPTRVFWLCASEELCEQAVEEFSAVWANLGNRSLSIDRYWGANKPDLSAHSDGLVVGSFAKCYAAAIASASTLAFLGDTTTLVVVDEAHQAIAPTYRQVIESLLSRNHATGLLGLTATPGRTWNDPAADRELADFFDHTRVTLQVDGYENPVEYLITEGYLARPHFRPLQTPGPAMTPAERARLMAEFEIPAFMLERLASDDVRNLLIVKEIEGLVADHARILAFSPTVEHARMLAAVLRVRGHEAHCVTSETPSHERQFRIHWYRQRTDEPRILTNFGVLTTGFDAPQTSAALIARPTKSLVLYSQMVGRATRGTRAGGNATAEIVTVIDTGLPGFGDMSAAFTNWEDIW